MTTQECPKKLKISWSQLQAFELCSHRSNLLRKQKRSPATDIRNFFHGTVCDRVMRAWLSSSDPLPGEMSEMVEDYIVKCLDDAKENQEGVVRWKHKGDREEMAAYCRSLLTGLEPMLFRWVIPYEYQPEFRFRVPIRIPYLDGSMAEIELIGGMDILVRRLRVPPMWFGYDLKATQNPDYIRKTLGQGIFYDVATLAMFEASLQEFVFLQPAVIERPFVTVKITDDDRLSMLSRIVKVAHGRWSNLDDPKKDSAGCSYCPVRHACKKYSSRNNTPFAPIQGRRPAG